MAVSEPDENVQKRGGGICGGSVDSGIMYDLGKEEGLLAEAVDVIYLWNSCTYSRGSSPIPLCRMTRLALTTSWAVQTRCQ